MTKIEKWLRRKQQAWNKDVDDGGDIKDISRETKRMIDTYNKSRKDTVEEFIN